MNKQKLDKLLLLYENVECLKIDVVITTISKGNICLFYELRDGSLKKMGPYAEVEYLNDMQRFLINNRIVLDRRLDVLYEGYGAADVWKSKTIKITIEDLGETFVIRDRLNRIAKECNEKDGGARYDTLGAFDTTAGVIYVVYQDKRYNKFLIYDESMNKIHTAYSVEDLKISFDNLVIQVEKTGEPSSCQIIRLNSVGRRVQDTKPCIEVVKNSKIKTWYREENIQVKFCLVDRDGNSERDVQNCAKKIVGKTWVPKQICDDRFSTVIQ